ncbi:MAG TPA: hypothetical protein VGE74_13775 [Gemmata sp.]
MRTGQGSLLLHWKLSQPPDRPYPEAELLAGLHRLREVLSRVPAVHDVSTEPDRRPECNGWLASFRIDLRDPLAWSAVKWLAHAVNDDDNGSTVAVLYPVWTGPDGPKRDFPMWWQLVPGIENLDAGLFAEYVEERIPALDSDLSEWQQDAEPGAAPDTAR